MRRKVFWITFIGLGLVADFSLSLVWGAVATIPIIVFAWWFAYRSELFDD